MTTAEDIAQFMDRLAPRGLAEDWDNTGLLIGRRDSQVTGVMTCLTLTADVAEEAINSGVELIVTHHPVMFRSVKRLTTDSAEGRMLLSLIEARVAVYSPHTSFDSAAQGINQQLAEAIGLQDIRPIRENEEDASVGVGRWGVLSDSVPLQSFLGDVRSCCSARYLEYTCGGRPVQKVALACGAAGEFLADARRVGCDTFVTGEGRFHSALEARTAGVNLIFVGHYSSERPAVEWLAKQIGAEFPQLDSSASAVERDPLELFTDE